MRYRYVNDISVHIARQGSVCAGQWLGSTGVMNDQNRDLKIASHGGAGTEAVTQDETGRRRRVRLWVNWVLALLTIPAAAVVLVLALGAVMSTAGCSDKQCPNLGPGGISFGVLFHGAPVVALLAIVISFFTARRRWGIVVPLCALALLAADIVIVAATVVH
jgi:hypothetical protein